MLTLWLLSGAVRLLTVPHASKGCVDSLLVHAFLTSIPSRREAIRCLSSPEPGLGKLGWPG